ncbi:MAG: hypothetical protein GY928_12105 [Colwellia sp.]|nr:hypothetical protein [Colwellia sp.]
MSIEKIFDLGTVYVTGSKVSFQKVGGLSKESYGELEEVKKSGSGKNARYLYKIIAKDFERLNKLRVIYYAYDALTLNRFLRKKCRIFQIYKKGIRFRPCLSELIY